MNTELISKIKDWIEFQQRSCNDGRYPVEMIAYDLKVPIEDVKEAIENDPEIKYQVK